jgi:hypothetical protein
MLPAFFRFAGRSWPAATVAEIGHIVIGPDGKPQPTGMARKHIVSTAPDGNVLITTPSLTAMCWMTCGSGRWDDVMPHEPPGFLERQVAAQVVGTGCTERAARRFVMAMQNGGASIQEAYEIVIDWWCAPQGTGHEVWPTEDMPTDWTYRAAWRRSHNGGPIWIDERKAMEIDEMRAWQAYDAAERRQEQDQALTHVMVTAANLHVDSR